MKNKKTDDPTFGGLESQNGKNGLPGYPSSPESEDIYNHFLKESEINPEDIQKNKELNKDDLIDEFHDQDLDIPGSELDDEMEIIGSEDEENNYYSIGGDDHEDLDESHDDQI
jgi:hypothetical protein